MDRQAQTITQLEFWPIDIPITDPFVVATGSRVVAENVFVRITLSDGAYGYGEAAPFPEVGGEDRETCLNALSSLAPLLIGRPAHVDTPILRRAFYRNTFSGRGSPPFFTPTKQKREPPFEKSPPSHLTSHFLRCTFHISHYPYPR
jgi:Mandelate racemase / muconate lactonizing enzyme, N-terminal domain